MKKMLLILSPIVLITLTSCGTIKNLNTMINQSTDSINANADAVNRSTEVIRQNKALIEETNKAIDENRRHLEALSSKS